MKLVAYLGCAEKRWLVFVTPPVLYRLGRKGTDDHTTFVAECMIWGSTQILCMIYSLLHG